MVPTLISLALLPMPLVLQSSTLFFLVEIVGWLFFLRLQWSWLLWDKGGFKVYVNKEAITEESKGWTSFLIAAFLWYSYNIPIFSGAPSWHYTIDMSKWCLQTSPGMLVLKGRTLVEIVRIISEKKQTANWSTYDHVNIPERRGFQQTPISKTKTWFFGTDLLRIQKTIKMHIGYTVYTWFYSYTYIHQRWNVAATAKCIWCD